MTEKKEQTSGNSDWIKEKLDAGREQKREIRSRRKRIVIRYLVWGGSLLGVAIIVIGTIWLMRTQTPAPFTQPTIDAIGSNEMAVSAFDLYFLDSEGGGLTPEIRYLEATGDFAADAKAVILGLIAGPVRGGFSPWPQEVAVQDIFVSSAGIAYISFGASLKWLLPRGDYMEWGIAATLTKTLCANFSEIRGVRILIDGESGGVLRRSIPLDWVFQPDMFEVEGEMR